MKRKYIHIGIFCFLAWLAFELENIAAPSDSGDMRWLNYVITKYGAFRGDIGSIIRMGGYYEYNADYERASEFFLKSVGPGRGGAERPWDFLLTQIIFYCSRLNLISPAEVAQSFAAVRRQRGGLTDEGKALESRWKAGAIPGCSSNSELP